MKLKSKILIGLTSSLFTSILVIATATSCSGVISTNTLNKNIFIDKASQESYIYDNKFFSSIDDVATYYISKNDIIDISYYLGNIGTAMNSDFSIDISEMRPYEPSKIYPAYLDSSNTPQYDFSKAKKSYAYDGSIRTRYYDFNNNLFNSYEDARQSIINSKNSTGVLFYNDLKINNEDTINFNPLSKSDLLKFKILAFDEALKGFKGESNSKFSLKIYNDEYDKDYTKFIDNKYIHNIIIETLKPYFQEKYDLLS
ncbi:MAG: hypothetical protein K2L64_02415, partial [Ureaplasma sp.]|nr:hypothetical protein [Ureaplasma sp.]